jgi:hypothetical protein
LIKGAHQKQWAQPLATVQVPALPANLDSLIETPRSTLILTTQVVDSQRAVLDEAVALDENGVFYEGINLPLVFDPEATGSVTRAETGGKTTRTRRNKLDVRSGQHDVSRTRPVLFPVSCN